MTPAESKRLADKIRREYPVRQKLAKMAGVKLDDQTLTELWVCAIISGTTVEEASNVARAALPNGTGEDTDR